MGRIRVYKNSQLIEEVSLDTQAEWIAGRSDDCSYKLDSEPGISRQHFKIVPDESGFRLETLSRYGELYFRGDKVRELRLESGDKVSVPPYDFEFIVEKETSEEVPVVSEVSQPSLNSDFERTVIGQINEVALLTLRDQEGDVRAIFQLEGDSWIAGRDTTCSLFLDNPRVSRFQFEVKKQDEYYLIKDLGSANGTTLNGQSISSEEWTRLNSGDQLVVVDWIATFELKDPQFQDRMANLPAIQESEPEHIYDPSQGAQPYSPVNSFPPVASDFSSQENRTYPGVYPQASAPGAYPYDQTAFGQTYAYGQAQVPKKKKPNIVRLLIVALLLGGGGYWYLGQTPAKKPANAVQRPQSPFDKLSSEQQQYVRDSYRLAENLFKQGRYELARQEIAKVHQLIPFFEDSKNIDQLASVAIETEIERQRAEDRERQALEIEQKITATTQGCRRILNADVVMSDLENCLGSVIALNPDHPSIASLRAEVDRLVTEKAIRLERSAEYQQRVRQHQSIYNRAESVEKSGTPLAAIEAYEKVLVSRLPDPGDLKAKAQRQIATIRQNLSDQQTALTNKASDAEKRGDLRAAYLALKDATKVDPNNQSIKSRMNTIMSELRKQMQPLYQEGILEESVGEVETAKTKWKRIIDQSVPEEEYYKKAAIKLKKYGVEVKN